MLNPFKTTGSPFELTILLPDTYKEGSFKSPASSLTAVSLTEETEEEIEDSLLIVLLPHEEKISKDIKSVVINTFFILFTSLKVYHALKSVLL